MPASKPLHLLYEELMVKPHPYGVPLYKPTSTRLMRPGSVGYFNDLGEWAPITQLDDLKTLQREGLKPPEEDLERVKYSPITTWDRKYSEGVNENDVSGKVGVKSETLPAAGSVTFEYKSSSNFGAVLITKSPVHRDAYYHESPFRRWVKDNAHVLMQHKRKYEIKTHGLCIITDVYSTEKCSVNAWTDSSRTVKVEFAVNALGQLDVGVGGGWSVQGSAGGWSHYAGEESTSEKDTSEESTDKRNAGKKRRGKKGISRKGSGDKQTSEKDNEKDAGEQKAGERGRGEKKGSGKKGSGEKGTGEKGTQEKGLGKKGTDRYGHGEDGHGEKSLSPGESAKHEEVVVFASGFKCHIGGLHRSVARAFGASGVGIASLDSTSRSSAQGVENTTDNRGAHIFYSETQSINGEDVAYEIEFQRLGLPSHEGVTEEDGEGEDEEDEETENEEDEEDENEEDEEDEYEEDEDEDEDEDLS